MRCFCWLSSVLFAAFVCSVASAQATYELTFDSGWSAATHPGAYPPGAHFSPLIGSTHNGAASYWEPGGIATSAIEQMAETGGTSQLRNLIQANITNGSAGDLVDAASTGAPGNRTLEFTVTAQHPLLSLVTMVAPSPDWFVGVGGLDLRANGQWIESLSIDLLTYDAGTDSGVNFTSSNADVTPHQPISVLGAPLTGLPVLASYSLTLISSEPLCDLNSDTVCDTSDLNLLLELGPLATDIPVNYGANDQFDLNGDGLINMADRDAWLAGAAAQNGFASAYLPADANLDGTVDGVDFLAWNASKFTESLLVTDGDFTGDGLVDGSDFLVWNSLKFSSSDIVSVPEPGAIASLLLVAMAAATNRRRCSFSR